ncbi:nucleotide exchange factor GrpE [Neobacillus sp. PS3-12]|uniref:nucleotide exchange factor GrpE n=1 Tax=Neobacillus sp. PS3-12 TaxID=3070677 RepID=UPI0027E10674|nr:nucleotide exchange factor GrpE [Neobacillus sp. PS3-12]WML54108.1 nucleotide exchange factor GrpE [Neobacillus sp. PS3-12]
MTVEKNDTINNEKLAEQTIEMELTDKETVEPVFAEEQNTVNEEEAVPDQLQSLLEKNDELEKKLAEFENRYLRLQADFDNSRRRSKIEAEANEKYRAQKLIIDILPAVDNFERALSMEVDNDQAKSLKQGMEMVYRSLLDVLLKEGLQPIEAVGKEFDPHLHQAVMQGNDENFGSNIVIEEFQKGYLLKDKVIRPSMVKVNQ